MPRDIRSLLLKEINTEIEVRPVNDEVAGEYALRMQDGILFDPAILFFDGTVFWLADGKHRYRAHEIAKIKRMVCEVRKGTKRDAILFAVGANAKHGLRRTNDDKRRAVGILLDDSEWKTWPNRKIAERCGVDEGLVRKIKAERQQRLETPERPAPTAAKKPAGADSPQPKKTLEVSDLPADCQAALNAMTPSERTAFEESLEADDEVEIEQETERDLRGLIYQDHGKMTALRRLKYHVDNLRVIHGHIPAVDRKTAVVKLGDKTFSLDDAFDLYAKTIKQLEKSYADGPTLLPLGA